MSHRWDQTIEIPEELVKKLLFEQFDLTVQSLSVLGEGFDNIAFLINQSWVFRFPRRELGVMCLHNEIALLPHFSSKISFPFSCPTLIGQPSPLFPYPFAGYPFLTGDTLADGEHPLVKNLDFARSLGLWLKELHSLPVEKKFYDVISGDQSWRLDVASRTEVIQKNTEQYQDIYEKEGFSIQEILTTSTLFSQQGFMNNKACFLHGDLYAKHILINEKNQLVGLIDWGDTHIGHPAIDLSVGFMIFDSTAREAFYQSYGGADDNDKHIALFRAFCHAATALPYFALSNDHAALAWTKAALQNTLSLSSLLQG